MVVNLRKNSLVLLPIFAALLLEAAIRFLSYQQPDATTYLAVHGQLLVEMLPFFVCHYLASTLSGRPALLIWLSGFIGYPLLSNILAHTIHAYGQWLLLEMQGVVLAIVASVLWFIHKFYGQVKQGPRSWIAHLLSLDFMVALSLFLWAFTMAGVFLYTDNPMVNQPLQMIIDFNLIVEQLPLFMQYFWQFSLMALVLFGVYWFNRYVLIRRLLAMHGLIPFLAGGLIFILLFSTPISALLLLMPLNNVTDFTLLPSENHNPFDPFNSQMTFWLLMFSTPIILAFERKSQDARVADIARRQTRTELQMLQQQVNPHFLFNTLNNLYALCLERSPQAPDMVEKLAGLLRYTVYQGQKEQVSLVDDVRYLQDYLALQSMRYTDDCHFQCTWPTQAERWQLSPLLLIIVLENAFKHGIEKASKPCELKLALTLDNNRLVFECKNPIGQSAQTPVDEDNSGLGLENLRRRLNLQYANCHELISEQRGNHWYTRLQMELAPC